jgi:hypothetical protein
LLPLTTPRRRLSRESCRALNHGELRQKRGR